MTPRSKSILVRGPLPPLPEPRVTFAPGSGATFDGERWHLSFAVVVEGDGPTPRQSFDRRRLGGALDAVREGARRVDPSAVVLDGRDWLRGPLPDRAVERIEASLDRTAREARAVLVVRTWDAVADDDHDRYGAVIDLADERTWRGEPADPPRRRCSRNPDTAPGRPTSEL